jgi:hypothetical protein
MNFCPGSKNSIIGKIARYEGLYGHAKYFWIVFTIKLKRSNLCHKLKNYVLKPALISL